MQPDKREVIADMEPFVEGQLSMLKSVEDSWQPTDFLPNMASEDWRESIAAFRAASEAIPDDVLVVLVGDMVTEEALPTYQTLLNTFEGVSDPTGASESAWARWSRGWTAEENRHGDLLNRYLYLTGRVDMRSIEVTIQHLIRNGFDPGAQQDPYKGFVYTSFQERATRISHRNVARLAQRAGDENLKTICGLVAGDEARHEKAYTAFISHIFDVDPSGALLAFRDLMKTQVVMPAHLMYDEKDPDLFDHFSLVAQRIGVYTAQHYAEIIEHLVDTWSVATRTGLSDEAAEAQEYLCKLGPRYARLAERNERMLDRQTKTAFSWIHGRSA